MSEGIYVGVGYSASTRQALADWAKDTGIPNPAAAEAIHTTVLFSRAGLPDHIKLNYDLSRLNVPWKVKAKGFALFRDILVLTLESAILDTLHSDLIKAGGSHDFPEYIPHITLSESAHGFDPASLTLPDFPLIPAVLYTEDLILREDGAAVPARHPVPVDSTEDNAEKGMAGEPVAGTIEASESGVPGAGEAGEPAATGTNEVGEPVATGTNEVGEPVADTIAALEACVFEVGIAADDKSGETRNLPDLEFSLPESFAVTSLSVEKPVAADEKPLTF